MTPTVVPVSADGRIVALDFDSPLLGRRTRSLVWLPPSWSAGGPPLPVVYYLHGTVATTLPPLARRLVDARLRRGRPVPFVLHPPGPAVIAPDTMRFDETIDRHRFLIVAPDAGAPPWCIACNWVDGARGRGVAAERHLYEELFPAVEATFGTRTDRGGRAIIGHSMGGGGAMIQAFRHPDRFAMVGCSSGTLTVMNDRTSRTGVRWLLYNRTQGFRPIPFDRARYREINLIDLAPNVVGSDLEIVVVVGDGVDDGERRPGSAPSTVPLETEARMERNLRRNNDLIVPRLRAAGVTLEYIRRTGIHTIGASTFREHLLPRLLAVFERSATDTGPAADPT